MASSLKSLCTIRSSTSFPISRRSTLRSCQSIPTISTASSTSSMSDNPFGSRNNTSSSSSIPSFPNSLNSLRTVKTRAQRNFPLISPQDHWGTWTALLASAAFGIWSENTKIGSRLSGPLMSILAGFTASNLGLISCEAPAYSAVMKYLRQVIQSTGTLLLAFLIGSVATAVGTVVAYLIVPMRSLGGDSWKIAAALMGRRTGGTVTYFGVSEILGISPSVLGAGLAADNVVCAIYFTALFALASKIPSEAATSTNGRAMDMESKPGNKLPLLETATALAVSFAICNAADYLSKLLQIKGGTLPCATAIVVILATIFPSQLGHLAPAGGTVAVILLQVFCAVVGANGSMWNVISTAPSIFMFSPVQIAVHLAVILGLGKLLGFDRKLLLLASNCNVGGPTTARGMATAKEWDSMVVRAILTGIFGIAIATFIAIGIGFMTLQFYICESPFSLVIMVRDNMIHYLTFKKIITGTFNLFRA